MSVPKALQRSLEHDVSIRKVSAWLGCCIIMISDSIIQKNHRTTSRSLDLGVSIQSWVLGCYKTGRRFYTHER